jgi:hypothetical protein
MAIRLSTLRVRRALLREGFSDTHFCYRLSKPQGLVRLEVLGKLKKFNDLATFLLAVECISHLRYRVLYSRRNNSSQPQLREPQMLYGDMFSPTLRQFSSQ